MALTGDSAQLWEQLMAFDSDSDSDSDGDADDDEPFELVGELNLRGEPAVVDWALAALTSHDAWHRQLAALTVAEHGYLHGRPYGARTTPLIVEAARTEADVGARNAMVRAIGRCEQSRYADELMRYADDEDVAIRETVAGELPHLFSGGELNDAAVDVLIRLMSDVDEHVRDWATFALDTQSELDSAAIRQALRDRLDDYSDDENVNTNGEAAVGLARRRDASVMPYIQDWLEEPVDLVGNMTIEAAGLFGDQRLLPRLKALRAAGWHEQPDEPRPEALTAAIALLEAVPTPAE